MHHITLFTVRSLQQKIIKSDRLIGRTLSAVLKSVTVFTVFIQFLILPLTIGQASAEIYSAAKIANIVEDKQDANYKPLMGPNYPISKGSYFTDDYGNILMIINVLGEVGKPGQMVVRENVDFAEILSLAGGTREKADLQHVLVARQEPDNKGAQGYKINLKRYFESGDRQSFIALKPNDTIYVPEDKGFKLGTALGVVVPGMSLLYMLKNY